MQIMKIDALSFALNYWNDANLFGELMFQSRLKHLNPSSELYVPLAGSEINLVGWLSREIPNYKNLEIELKKNKISNPYIYLPRIPKECKDLFTDKYDFLESRSHGFAQFPLHIAEWLKTKKVCRVTQEVEIPQIPLSQNYFKFLPYNSFVMYLNDPFVFNFSDTGFEDIPEMVEYFRTFIVSRIKNMISIYCIADGLDEFCMEPIERNLVADATRHAKGNHQNDYKRAMKKIFSKRRVPANINDYDNLFRKLTSTEDGEKIEASDLIRPYNFSSRGTAGFFNVNIDISNNQVDVKEENNSDGAKKVFFEMLPEFLNGFCKLFSETSFLIEGIGNKVIEVSDSEKSEKNNLSLIEPLDLSWFEVPIGNVVDLHIQKNATGGNTCRISIGSEKSPHVRRGHFRRYPQPNGEIKSVWIEQVTVRADRLKDNTLKSGASKIV